VVRFKADVVDLHGLQPPSWRQKTGGDHFLRSHHRRGCQRRHPQYGAILDELRRIPLNDAGMLMSLAGQLKFCQVVDPLKTVRFGVPQIHSG